MKMCNYVIGRAIDGVCLNGWEFVLDGKDGDVMVYDTQEKALEFLKRETGETDYTPEEFEEEYGAHILDESLSN
jgi:hypothetical protein